jgi:hypothetical protein
MDGEVIGEIVAGLLDVATTVDSNDNRNNGCAIFAIVLVVLIVVGCAIYYFT